MTIEEQIKALVEERLAPVSYQLINESAKHVGHAGDDGSGQTHFNLVVVSSVFDGMSRVQCHQYVNSMLEGLFDKGLHAISLKLSSPQ